MERPNCIGQRGMTRKPFRSCMIGTVPRSGSPLLCGLLAATDVAGDPDSHFHAPSLERWLNGYALKRTDHASEGDAVRAVFDAAWERWFQAEGLTPLRLTCEALSDDSKRLLAQGLSALDLDPARARSVALPVRA